MNYFEFFKKLKTTAVNSENIELKLKIKNFLKYCIYDSNDERIYNFYLEFDDKKPTLMKLSLESIWTLIKNYVSLETIFDADAIAHYDDYKELVWIEIKKLKYKDLVILPYGFQLQNESINNNYVFNMKNLKTNPILILFILLIFNFILFILFGRFSAMFLVIFLANAFILYITAYLRNRTIIKKGEQLLQNYGFNKKEQEYLECCEYIGGFLQEIRYKQEIKK